MLALGVTLISGSRGALTGGARPMHAEGGDAGLASQGAVELNLLHGNDFVNSSLTYSGVYNTTNSSFPALLTGANASQFWPTGQPVLLMAPIVSYIYGHDGGLVLFPGGSLGNWTINAVGTSYPEFNGDRISAYFMVTPTNNSSWNPDYFATNPPVPNYSPLACGGTVIFPYSATPYVVLQWDPSWTVSGCGQMDDSDFALYLVTPSSNGAVTSADIQWLGPFGSTSGRAGLVSPGDEFNLSATYWSANDTVSAYVVDQNFSTVSYSVRENLTQWGFDPAAGSTPGTVLGIGEGASSNTGWGLLYAAYSSEATPSVNHTAPPPSPPSPPPPPVVVNVTANSSSQTSSHGANLTSSGPPPALPWPTAVMWVLVGALAATVAVALWRARRVPPSGR